MFPSPTAWRSAGSTTFIGTGTNGVVYRFDGKNVKAFANTGELLVASLAFGRDGALYAGTLPNGHIYRIDAKSGKSKRFSTPAGAKHIWALHYDKKRGQLIAGTGPEGKVFAVDSIGRAKQLHKAEAAHIMTLAGDGKGTIYAGTSDDAVVLRISAEQPSRGRARLPGQRGHRDRLSRREARRRRQTNSRPLREANSSRRLARPPPRHARPPGPALEAGSSGVSTPRVEPRCS